MTKFLKKISPDVWFQGNEIFFDHLEWFLRGRIKEWKKRSRSE